MRIAFLNDMMYDYAFQSGHATWTTGGAERQSWLLARAMASAGWKVTVGVRRSPLRPGETTELDGVRFVGIGQEHILRAWYRFFRSEPFDWWFWQGATHLLGFGVALAHLAGVKAIFGTGFDRDVRVREALYHRPRWWPAYALGLSQAERIAVQHGGQRSGLPERWRRKAYVVPNIAFGSDILVPHAERPPTVAWIAALRVAKRPDRLIEIARLLPHVRFVVCGSPSTYMTPAGYSDRAIETFATIPNIDYRGQVSPEAALRISSQSSILLSTSDEEGFPQTFLEAWSHGTPTVTLGIDPDRVIQELSLGAVCSDVRAAAAAISRLIASPDLREQMSTNARQYVSRAHNPAAAVLAIERAIAGSRSTPGVGEHSEGIAV